MIIDLSAWFDKIKNIKSALFADDLVIWISVPKRQEYQLSQIMNEALTALGNWCNVNAMTINTEKTFYQMLTLNHKNPMAS
jgi:trans-2-enoyl-CoA reductase